ncbi:MAG: prepilin-type N-terminal cleavage/methylation domain-containing protein [Planctomycetota bacterium]
MTQHNHHSQRHGFTLIEVLVVVGLIAFLMALSIGVLRNSISSAKERATEATITKINGLVQQRVDAFNRAMERSDLEPGIQQMLAKMSPANRNNKAMRRANEVMVKKDFFRYRFPQNFEEKNLLVSPPSGVTITLSAHKHETQSAALLYWLLTQSEVYGVAPVDESAFGSAEIKDTDGDGLLEFIDGWGKPLRFYRWPTRLFRCGEDFNENGALDAGEDENNNGNLEAAPGPTSPVIRRYANQIWSGLPAKPTVTGDLDPLARDPDDPLGQLLRAVNYGFFTASQIEVGIPVPAPTPAIPYHTIETYHAYLIVSTGPDLLLGLHEPSEGWPNASSTGTVTTVGRLAGLTQRGSLDNHPINDNITNRKR